MSLIPMFIQKRRPPDYGQPRLGDVKRNYSDISKAKMMLGYELQYDLNKGLKKTLDYFLAVNKNSITQVTQVALPK
jgi:nucleoside-diphosphate-sugar epimerase